MKHTTIYGVAMGLLAVATTVIAQTTEEDPLKIDLPSKCKLCLALKKEDQMKMTNYVECNEDQLRFMSETCLRECYNVDRTLKWMKATCTWPVTSMIGMIINAPAPVTIVDPPPPASTAVVVVTKEQEVTKVSEVTKVPEVRAPVVTRPTVSPGKDAAEKTGTPRAAGNQSTTTRSVAAGTSVTGKAAASTASASSTRPGEQQQKLPTDDSESGSEKMQAGTIAAIALAVVIGVAIVVGAALWYRRRRQRSRPSSEVDAEEESSVKPPALATVTVEDRDSSQGEPGESARAMKSDDRIAEGETGLNSPRHVVAAQVSSPPPEYSR